MKFKDFKNLKIDLPKNWREISRVSSEGQFYAKIYHINPITFAHSSLKEEILPSANPNVTIRKLAVPLVSSPPLGGSYSGMRGAISSGPLLSGWTMKKLDDLHEQMTALDFPEDGDHDADIIIAQYENEEVAKQSFKNMALMPTQGFDIPMPGTSKNMTIAGLLESDIYEKYYTPENFEEMKKHMSEEQQKIAKEQIKKIQGDEFKKQLETVRAELKKVRKEIAEKTRPSLEKSGTRYKEGKYLGYDVIYVETRNPSPPPKSKVTTAKKKSSGASGGGDSDGRYDPLPKIIKPYLEKFIIYQAILVKNFVINSNLLSAVSFLSPGNTPCYSLTKTKRKTITTKVEGETFTDIFIVPLVSNYAKEGYLYREEVEKIIKNIITSLKQLN